MAYSLEQLDVYGSIENVPYSLDNSFYDGKVCGSWTLEQLDNFGSLDSLTLPLDSELWVTGACINIADVTIDANAVLMASAERTLGFLLMLCLLFQHLH